MLNQHDGDSEPFMDLTNKVDNKNIEARFSKPPSSIYANDNNRTATNLIVDCNDYDDGDTGNQMQFD